MIWWENLRKHDVIIDVMMTIIDSMTLMTIDVDVKTVDETGIDTVQTWKVIDVIIDDGWWWW